MQGKLESRDAYNNQLDKQKLVRACKKLFSAIWKIWA